VKIMRDIDAIIEALIQTHPELSVDQLKVLHPGVDDDGLWFFTHPSSPNEVQLESPHGMCPFIFETDANPTQATADTILTAVSLVAGGLGLPAA
jgi:hypothetical protein